MRDLIAPPVRSRRHPPTPGPGHPKQGRNLSGLTHYMSDPGTQETGQCLAQSDPVQGRRARDRRGRIPARSPQGSPTDAGLFTQTIALRLRSRDEVNMVLGDGMADKEPAHRIDPNKPGTGYVIAEDGAVMKVRAHYWTDDQIRTTAT